MDHRGGTHTLPFDGRSYGIDEYVTSSALSPFLTDTSLVNDNSDGIKEVLDMLGVMYITALEMLHECALTGPTSPLPDNLGVMTLFFLDFMRNTASNFDIDWAHEIVRAADAYGVVLAPVEHVKGVDQGVLDDLRETCERTKKKMGLAWKTEVS